MQAMHLMLEAIRASHTRAGSPARVLIALSGGADSLLLAQALHVLRDALHLRLSCVHIHHGLRQASDEEEAFVRAFCAQRDLPIIVRYLKLAGDSNLEARARAGRYQAFEEAMKMTGAQVLALGHHQNDQAETLLLRLVSGAGATGLSAMRELSGYLWRPLLAVSRADIMAALKDAGLHWREDESNRDSRFRRNALRMGIMPKLEAIAPGAVQAMARSARILQDEEDYWQDYVADWLHRQASTQGPCIFLLAAPCLALHLAAQRRVLRGLCAAAGISSEFAHIEGMVALLSAAPGSVVNLPDNAHALRSRGRLHITRQHATPAPLGKLLPVEGEALPQPKESLCQALDLDAMAGAVLRYRQPGDRISPLGAGGSKALNEYLSDKLVDRPFRDHWPILAKEQQVLWVVGLGIAQEVALSGSTRRAGLMAYKGKLPHWLDSQHLQGDASDATT